MENRVYNFSAGPATLPLPALEQAQRDLLCLPGVGASVMEISHRSPEFTAIIEQATADIRELLQVPDSHKILFIQGGASLQFSMLAMNLLRGTGKSADYILTGSWGVKAIKEARKEGPCRVAWDGKDENYVRVPENEALQLNPDAAYVHFTSNETIQGVQFKNEPDTGNVPLVCDASSDILSRPLDISRYALLYAGAQKNIGPSGIAVVILREDMLERVPENLPSLMDYSVIAGAKSLYNTPPTFAIYMIGLVTKWLKTTYGSLEKIHAVNKEKARMLYEVIDQSGGFYKGHAVPECRSIMNVTWTLAEGPEKEQDFLEKAREEGLVALKGHRSVGGIRASIYNAMPREGVQALCEFMREYQRTAG